MVEQDFATMPRYECGEDFCEVCGDCMHCNEEFPCWVADEEGTKPHVFVAAIDEDNSEESERIGV